MDSWGPGRSQPSVRRSRGLEFKCREVGAKSCGQGDGGQARDGGKQLP